MMDGSALDLVTAMGMMNRNNDGYDSDGFGCGNGIWLLVILFFMFAIGGGGFGGFGWGGNGAMNQLTNEFLFTNLNQSIQRNADMMVQQNFGLQKDLCQGFAGVQAAIAENRFASEKCCCETKEQILQNRYENAKNTCDVITAVNAGTQRVIDQMQNDKIQELRESLNTATIGNLIQQAVQSIVGQVRPTPTPSYTVCSPYESRDNLTELLLLSTLRNNNCGCGNNWNNCGCGWNGNCNGFNYNF